MDIKLSGHQFYYDITSIAMLFFHGEKVNYVRRGSTPLRAVSRLAEKDDRLISFTSIHFRGNTFTSQKTAPYDCDRKNLVKQTFYIAASRATGISPLWGILTGIRPLSVYARLALAGDTPQDIMKREYYVAPQKLDILSSIYGFQQAHIEKRANDVSVYVSIPFCPGKCSYCSFISVSAVNNGGLLESYLEKLYLEIKAKSELVKALGLNVKTLYVGGGTPGVLSENQLESLLKILVECFDTTGIEEICFELGRPDTVTDGKLAVLKSHGVNRVCINTQTTNDKILSNVFRNHTAAQYFSAVEKAKKYGFDSINTDLIAGLTGEETASFCRSLNEVIESGADNITVHTLAIKRAAALSGDRANYVPYDPNINKMLDYAYNKLTSYGFSPYYIYRQKNCISNGENIGYCKGDKLCRYNVYMMEDIHSIIACGAGASSKIIDGGRVERVINVKYPTEYVNEYEKVVNNTEKLRLKWTELKLKRE